MLAGDQVWLQPATPPKGVCFCRRLLAVSSVQTFHHGARRSRTERFRTNLNSANPNWSGGNRAKFTASSAMSRAVMSRVVGSVASGLSVRRPPGSGVPAAHVSGELNPAIISGLGDDGGYGGGWVPLVALKKVLRGILKYLGVLWLFAQLPDLLREILGSILKENEGALLNLDQEQPALHFFVG
ncbi:Mediator of RNA polymerase II transcription subunit 14 [Raphanus sativus]|uniref:Mediator of RNA polymerase II transcription subunit 14 isoform X1 n=1 Tax=Raphanus sativus TaxID=3726 RepID=A0A9W3DRV5_RAPSA|nr:mediator of RNA polymerase II transcription subunit 14 isoform X1 [Raphanus sativus]KAJ4898518.1 Mediator of RNA polymerase II transcription subunit 14 [Raphanus sativus]